MSALSIMVPRPEEIILKADIIVIGRYTNATSTLFVVDEVLKSETPVEETVQTYSPYPPVSHSLQRDIDKMIGEQTILLGRWGPDKNAVMVLYASSSFWPQGIPPDGQPVGTLSELRSFILTQLGKGESSRVITSSQSKLTLAAGAATSDANNSALRLSEAANRSPQVEQPKNDSGLGRDATRRWSWTAIVAILALVFGISRIKRR